MNSEWIVDLKARKRIVLRAWPSRVEGKRMRNPLELVLTGMLSVALLLGQGCATSFGSGTGDEEMVQEEQIEEPAIKYIPPPSARVAAPLKNSAMRAELSARNATGLPQGALSDVLFDFDEATLRADALPILQVTAGRLNNEGVSRVILEGHGDEAGTAAYNIVLGDRRAKRVKAYLQELGLLSVSLKTMSYGKDRPLCFQHSSDCLQQNRSVHFVVKD
jgi:peptidoglycan-associated lipoprotein